MILVFSGQNAKPPQLPYFLSSRKSWKSKEVRRIISPSSLSLMKSFTRFMAYSSLTFDSLSFSCFSLYFSCSSCRDSCSSSLLKWSQLPFMTLLRNSSFWSFRQPSPLLLMPSVKIQPSHTVFCGPFHSKLSFSSDGFGKWSPAGSIIDPDLVIRYGFLSISA